MERCRGSKREEIQERTRWNISFQETLMGWGGVGSEQGRVDKYIEDKRTTEASH